MIRSPILSIAIASMPLALAPTARGELSDLSGLPSGDSPALELDWIEDQLSLAQFQPPILPDSLSPIRIANSADPNLSPLDVRGSLNLLPLSTAGVSTPVATVSTLQTLLQPTSSGIDSLLIASRATNGQRRQETASEIVMAGRRKGQTSGGSHWIPAREDLDTMLSKIDSRLVASVEVTKGPYNVTEGPGLAFFDVHLLKAPRFENGYESHGQTIVEYQTNGERIYGRQMVSGGSNNWGYRIGYGHRTGNDFETGDGNEIPSSFNSRTPDIALGTDISDVTHVDFHYFRLDQTNVEFPGQVFDMDFLVTDAFDLSLSVEGERGFDEFEFEGWYNRTRFEGANLSPGKRRQVTALDDAFPFRIFGNTDVDALSAGFLSAIRWGDEKTQISTGFDLRYTNQELNEFSRFGTNQTPINRPIPASSSVNPGVFWQGQLSNDTGDFRFRSGARVDWVSTDADTTVLGTSVRDIETGLSTMDLEDFLGADFERQFRLWSLFVSADRRLNNQWTVLFAAGDSMRPPTMTELYAIEPFLAVMPQFLFNSPRGNPTLEQEKQWQVDLGLQGEFRRGRLGVNAFHTWIHDYITYDNLANQPFPGSAAVSITFVNTDLATLAGVEFEAEYDLTKYLTAFAAASYIEGRDQTRNGSNSPIRAERDPGSTRGCFDLEEEPLPVMPPLDAVVGHRLQKPEETSPWAIEFSARIVDRQDRIAFVTLGEQETPGFTIFDMRGYWQPTYRHTFTAGIENLGDRTYREHVDPRPATLSGNFFQPGRSFFFGYEATY